MEFTALDYINWSTKCSGTSQDRNGLAWKMQIAYENLLEVFLGDTLERAWFAKQI